MIYYEVTLTFLRAITSKILVNNIIIPSISENKANTISMLRTVILNRKECILLKKYKKGAYHVCFPHKQIHMRLYSNHSELSQVQP